MLKRQLFESGRQFESLTCESHVESDKKVEDM